MLWVQLLNSCQEMPSQLRNTKSNTLFSVEPNGVFGNKYARDYFTACQSPIFIIKNVISKKRDRLHSGNPETTKLPIPIVISSFQLSPLHEIQP